MKKDYLTYFLVMLIAGIVVMLTGCDGLSVTNDISKSLFTEHQGLLYFGAFLAVYGFVGLFTGHGKTFIVCTAIVLLLAA